MDEKGDNMVSKKDIMEIKRRFKKEECTIQKLCGCYVDASRTKVTTWSETFLNLDEEEFYKYLEIAKKSLSGTIGNNILELSFPNEEEMNGGMQQFFMGLKESELKNDELVDRLYDRIIENYDYAGNYLILLFYDVYDVPLKTSDNMKLDESEEMLPYIITAICPVNLSKPGLGYLADDNRIGSRIRDWVVDMPDMAFMFPSFAERSADVHSLTYYLKDPKDSRRSFVEKTLGTNSKRTQADQKITFNAIVKRAVAPIMGEDESLLLDIQQSLKDKIPECEDAFGETYDDETAVLTTNIIAEVLKENDIPDAISEQIQEDFKEVFEEPGDELPSISAVIDDKKLEIAQKEKREEELELQVVTLQKELVEKTFEAVANSENEGEDEEGTGFSQSYDVILRVKPDKVSQIHTDTVDGKRCVVIPLSDGEYVNLNGINTKL